MILAPGAAAPDFTLVNQFGQPVRLAELRGRAIALVFFPLAFSGICHGELCELRDNIAMFEGPDVALHAISVDSKHTLRAWAEREGFDFPLLADFWPHGAVAQAYGVFNEAAGVANRGTFVIDKGGVVRYAEMNLPGEARDQLAWRKALAELAD